MQEGEGRGVSNGLDRGRVDIVDDDRISTSDATYPNTSKSNKSIIATTTRTRSGYGNGDHKMSQATRQECWTLGTIQ